MRRAIAQHNEENAAPVPPPPPPPAPLITAEQECPCGSGKPFLQCHGAPDEEEATA
jgi:preprotein translocase subunit SecA